MVLSSSIPETPTETLHDYAVGDWSLVRHDNTLDEEYEDRYEDERAGK